jgi:hypothetical protein
MYNKITTILTVIAITAFGMITAPTISTINTVFAAGFKNFFNSDGTINIDNVLKSNQQIPRHSNNQGSGSSETGKTSSDTGKSSETGKTSGSGGNSHAGEKCGANGGNTKDWYCHGTHHHCAKGQDNCELEGGRT